MGEDRGLAGLGRAKRGCYLLRSNITDWEADQLWQAHIQLNQVEAAFRIKKGDLRIRPIWHQKEEKVKAHVLACFLAYVSWKMIGRCAKGPAWVTSQANNLMRLPRSWL